jgi:hypothetical protein
MRSPRRLLALVLAAGLLTTGCEPPAPAPVDPQWKGVDLPMPPGPPGRLMLRDVATCGGKWYVVGAIGGADGATRPAAWTSADATSWTSLRLTPLGDDDANGYYGRRAILYAIGCDGGKVAAIGAKVGGAHGNPRVNTWRQLADGSLAQVPADFELYGGPRQVNVSRVAGGSGGWLMAGSRESGAAVWRSPDAAGFEILEGVAPLASDPEMITSASDAMAIGSGWLVAGTGRRPARADRDPVVWASPDGRQWRRLVLPATSDDEAVHRLLRVRGAVVALGVRGGSFAAWRTAEASGLPADGAEWRGPVTFGSTGVGTLAAVQSATADDALLVVTTVGADGHRLWWSTNGEGWSSLALPADVPAGGDAATAAATADRRVLVTTDDGTTSRAWTGRIDPQDGARN